MDYLLLDGSHFKMHDGSRAEPVLVAYGITTVGQPVHWLSSPADASHTTPGQAAWRTSQPGGSGCRCWSSQTARQTSSAPSRPPWPQLCACLIHRCRNVVAKVPAERGDEIKTAFWEICALPEYIEAGADAVHAAQANIDAFAVIPSSGRC